MRRWLMAAPLLALAGCSIGKDVPIAEQGAVALHKQYNDGKCANIRKDSAPEFKGMSTDKGWQFVCDQLTTGLGKFQSSKQTGWQDQIMNGDHRISIVYDSTFEKGKAREEFLYRIQDGKGILLGYHINSPVFDDKPANATEPANGAEPANAAAPA